MNYSYKKQTALSFAEAVEKTKAELAKEGFGILTEIDVKATLKQKLNAEHENYMILGACNPPFAHQALQAEKEIGLFMPCNVIVYDMGADTFVSAILPSAAMGMLGNPALSDIVAQAEVKLKKVIDAIE
jgi:uncharacterized protein (DUF302 family)